MFMPNSLEYEICMIIFKTFVGNLKFMTSTMISPDPKFNVGPCSKQDNFLSFFAFLYFMYLLKLQISCLSELNMKKVYNLGPR